MKNLLISKSFSYEIVDFTLLRQSNTYHLGGDRSIQLSYEDLYEKLANWQVIQLVKSYFYFALKIVHLPLKKWSFIYLSYRNFY